MHSQLVTCVLLGYVGACCLAGPAYLVKLVLDVRKAHRLSELRVIEAILSGDAVRDCKECGHAGMAHSNPTGTCLDVVYVGNSACVDCPCTEFR